MLYFATPSGPRIVREMVAGRLGMIDTPHQGSSPFVRECHAARVTWCADNGAFSNKWEADHWWGWLEDQRPFARDARFATAPDVVADAEATEALSRPWLPRIRALGFPVAYVAQDGMEDRPYRPWVDADCLFLGGSTAWKLGPHARELATEAKAHGLWVHMGRVNSERRWGYARAIGCDSADGTILRFGPDRNLPDVLAWLRHNDQPSLFDAPDPVAIRDELDPPGEQLTIPGL